MNITQKIILAAIPAGLISFVMSFIIGGFLFPFPETPIANAFGNGMSGLISGVFSAAIATGIAFKSFLGRRNG